MAVFYHYLPPLNPGQTPAQGLRTVSDGFSVLAFVFTLPWLVVNRLWIPALLYGLGVTALGVLATRLGLHDSFEAVLLLVPALFVGLEAGRLQAWGLERRGFVASGAHMARTRDEAELKFFAATRTM